MAHRAYIMLVFIGLFAFSNVSTASDYEITIYIIPPRFQIDFTSPQRLLFTALGNATVMHHSIGKHRMGHAYIELKGPGFQQMTGSSKENLFLSGLREFSSSYGLGMLFLGFPGKLDMKEILTKETRERLENGKIVFMTFLIGEEGFERLSGYLAEYQARGYHRIYNGKNQPRKGLGAGCTAFAISFLELAGFMNPHFENAWSNRVKVPDHLIGGPVTGNKASMLDILLARRWADEVEPHKEFEIYDPYLMYEWVLKVWNSTDSDPDFLNDIHLNGCDMTRVMQGKAKGLLFDCRHIPTPQEPVFYDSPELAY